MISSCPICAAGAWRALFVGDPVAAVFAETLDQAKDAAEQIAIEWDALPAITETRVAADPEAPQAWPQAPNNTCLIFDAGNRVAVDEALAKAAHTVSFTYVINRTTAVTMDSRASLATYDPLAESYTLGIAACRIRMVCASRLQARSLAFPATGCV